MSLETNAGSDPSLSAANAQAYPSVAVVLLVLISIISQAAWLVGLGWLILRLSEAVLE
jgi:hypothetical protein